MTIYLYIISVTLLIVFSILTGEIHMLSIEKIALFVFLLILGYAALAVGGFMDDPETHKRRRLYKK